MAGEGDLHLHFVRLEVAALGSQSLSAPRVVEVAAVDTGVLCSPSVVPEGEGCGRYLSRTLDRSRRKFAI